MISLKTRQQRELVESVLKLCSWYLTTQKFAMNAFYEHHQDSIRFGYRCFDRILLNGLIQPFQQPERVIGFFGTYRNQYLVSRDVLHKIAEQFQNWVKNRAEKWDVPILEAPEGSTRRSPPDCSGLFRQTRNYATNVSLSSTASTNASSTL